MPGKHKQAELAIMFIFLSAPTLFLEQIKGQKNQLVRTLLLALYW